MADAPANRQRADSAAPAAPTPSSAGQIADGPSPLTHDSVRAEDGQKQIDVLSPSPSTDPAPRSPMSLDPLQELCPSLHQTQALCLQDEESLEHVGGQSYRKARLAKIILKAASSGDMELLHWICYTMKADTQEAKAFRGLSWSSLRDEHGTGPVNLAASSGHVEAVRLLVRQGAEIDERDALGWTPLLWAVNSGNLPLVSFLLSSGADVGAKTQNGATCEDFILSSTTPESRGVAAAKLQLSSDSTSALSSGKLAAPPSPMTSDRQLIGDIIFEHQQALQIDQDRRHSNVLHNRLSALRLGSDDEKGSDAGNLSDIDMQGSGRGQAIERLIESSSSSWGGHSRTSSATMRRLVGREERLRLAEADLQAGELAEGRRRALLDIAETLQIDFRDLVGESPSKIESAGHKRQKRRGKKSSSSGLASGCGAIEVGEDVLSQEFDFSTVRPDQMLVIGEKDVQAIINHVVRDARPIRAPWTLRSKPANVLYLCLRYASMLGDEDLKEELSFAMINAVEASLYKHAAELTFLAFWMHNSVLLLHYMQRDGALSQTDGDKEHSGLMAELINEIYLFLVREMERRLDKILDAAILDHEAIPSMEDLQYEDEWSFIKSLKGSVRSMGQSAYSSPSGRTRRPLSQIFASDPAKASPSGSVKAQPQSPSVRKRAATNDPATSVGTPKESIDALSPRTVINILTSVLHVLQLYEINPSIIVQALSQVLYWVGCELFNRILSQRRYLCKAKAIQIRLNLSSIEDWIKNNALPMSLVTHHFAKLNQLISWVLCQSSLGEFDALISTLQGMKALNPYQLKHVLSEYRYETGESRISAEGIQYLDQLQSDWRRSQKEEAQIRVEQEGKRLQAQKEASTSHSRYGTATQDDPNGKKLSDEEDEMDGSVTQSSLEEGDDTFHQGKKSHHDSSKFQSEGAENAAKEAQDSIDALFAPGNSMNDYVPYKAHKSAQPDGQSAERPSTQLLLNSREMLPFALPSQPQALVVSPGDAFGFGRGHFAGTGTPSLKSMRTPSLLPSPSPSARGSVRHRLDSAGSSRSSLRASSPTKHRHIVDGMLSPPPTAGVSSLASPASRNAVAGLGISGKLGTLSMHEDNGGEGETPAAADGASVASSSTSNVTSAASSIAMLYPQGKGLAAGASWQPVPLLPDGALESLSAIMRISSSSSGRIDGRTAK